MVRIAGSRSVQLAAWGGARVFATVNSAAKAKHALLGGAHTAIDFTRENVAERVLELTDGLGANRVIEVDFGGNLAVNIKLIAQDGTIAAYASRGDTEPRVPFYELMRRNTTVHGVLLPGTPIARRKEAQKAITDWLAGGTALVTVAKTFDLAEVVHAHQTVEVGGKIGTVVVRCS